MSAADEQGAADRRTPGGDRRQTSPGEVSEGFAQAETLGGDLREAVLRGLRIARVIDPSDGTVPFFDANDHLVWTSPDRLVDTLLANLQAALEPQERT